MINKIPNQRGIAILYAVLLTTIILTIGLILADIITKQIVLSSIGKNSQTAYYAATLGKECALYWDLQRRFGHIKKSGGGGSELVFDKDKSIKSGESISCSGTTLSKDDPALVQNVSDEAAEYSFYLRQAGNSCAFVEIKKDPQGIPATTLITSSGYNVSCEVIKSGNIPGRAVERTVQIER